MNNSQKILLFTSTCIFLVYLIYGIGCLDYPRTNPDENWEISRSRTLLQTGHIGDQTMPKEVSPFFASLFTATPANQFIGIFKTGAFALAIKLLPLSEHQAIRFVSFIWSILLCFTTWLLAKEFKLNRYASIFSVVALIIVPEFFMQIHGERTELALSLCFAIYFLLLLRANKIESLTQKRIFLFLIGLASWLPAIGFHPTGLFLPPSLCLIYLVLNKKQIFNITTLLLFLSVLPGFLLYAWMILEIPAKALAMGGGNYFDIQGPPILVKGPIYILKLPLLFYNNFYNFNFLSRPASFLWTLLCFAGLFFGYKKQTTMRPFLPAVLTAIICSLLIAFLLSGSYGAYNIIILPFLAVAAGYWIERLLFQKAAGVKPAAVVLFCIFITGVFFSNAFGAKKEMTYISALKKLKSDVRNEIPPDAPVLGSILYYTTFKDQPFYHIAWFDKAGIPGQSFEQGIKVLKVKYIIVDDILLGKAIAAKRESNWIPDMINFLETKCTLENTFSSNYKVGNRVANPDLYPAFWKYPALKRGLLQKVCIYKVNP